MTNELEQIVSVLTFLLTFVVTPFAFSDIFERHSPYYGFFPFFILLRKITLLPFPYCIVALTLLPTGFGYTIIGKVF